MFVGKRRSLSDRWLADGHTAAAFVLTLAALNAATQQMTEQHPASWSARRLREMVAEELGLLVTPESKSKCNRRAGRRQPNGTYFVALGLVFRVPLVDFERFGRACLG